MGIEVHGDANLRMSEQFHHDSWTDSLYQQKRCAGMPEIMEPLVPEFRFPQFPLKCSRHIRGIKWGSATGREH